MMNVGLKVSFAVGGMGSDGNWVSSTRDSGNVGLDLKGDE
jgi:hypothetical protein